MRRLSRATLAELPAFAVRPSYDLRDLTAAGVGIVHLGLGAFHRAHQAVYTDAALAERFGPWGICGVSLRSPAAQAALAPQDGLYQVVVEGGDGPSAQVVGCLREMLHAPSAPAAVLARLAAPTTRLVTLTITEAGYGTDPEIAGDLRRGSAGEGPRSAVGYLVAGLARRRAAGAGPLALVSCDNVARNGQVLAKAVRDFAAQVDARLVPWIDEQVRFPSTMVDRIVPAVPPEQRQAYERATGVEDRGALFTEPFRQWVIEDDFPAGGRPAWEAGGAQLVRDTAPFEKRKLRLLNASHSALAYLGGLAGYTYVHECLADPSLRAFVAALMDEAAPTLAWPDAHELREHQSQLLARFAHPALRHRLDQIAKDGSEKLPQRVLGTIAERLRTGDGIGRLALAVAAWMVYLGDDSRTIDDPRAATLVPLARASRRAPGDLVDALLRVDAVFPRELAQSSRLRDELVTATTRLLTR